MVEGRELGDVLVGRGICWRRGVGEKVIDGRGRWRDLLERSE